ncbi:MAG TPA: T9SS type A sorting domain-containing protein [Bacteroidia bacterium]|nr:T9SS type A sorting domain-containing protein [Bacteroidia bacterium]
MTKRLFFSIITAFGYFGLMAQSSGVLIQGYATTSQANCPTPVSYTYVMYGNTYTYGPNDSVDCFIDFGDGFDTTKRVPLSYNNQVGSFSFYSMHTITSPGIYTATFIATGPDGDADTIVTTKMVTNTCNNVTGKFYKDNNSDCAFNAGDDPFIVQNIYLYYNNAIVGSAWTNGTGDFSFSALSGYTYTMRPAPIAFCSYACAGSDSIVFALSGSYNGDFIVDTTAGFSVNSYGDSSITYCTVPTSINFYVSGEAIGYAAGSNMSVYVNFGDGNDTSVLCPIYNSNTPLQSWNSYGITHNYFSPGNYAIEYIVTDPNGASDTIIVPNDVVISGTCGNLEGIAYLDNNSNCLFDAGDSVISNMWVYVSVNNAYAAVVHTDVNGHYSVSLYPGNYNVGINQNNGYTLTCPSSGMQTVTITSSTTTTADFGMECPPGNFDLRAVVNAWGFRPGFSGLLYTTFSNLTCLPTNATVKVILDPMTTYVAPYYNNTPVPTISGDTLIWSVSNLSLNTTNWNYNQNYFAVEILTDISAQLGDTLHFSVSILPTTGDDNTANNFDDFSGVVRSSWDPNYKQVFPEGIGSTHDVAPQTDFNYTIHFQNLGNAPAMNVLVTDTLDPDLDLTTFHVTGSSHFVQPNIEPGNVLTFRFPNINLPDSASDPAGSQGWVSFNIESRNGLSTGTQITNTANIYFDFNPAVITNTTLNTIDIALSVNESELAGAKVYPNPADDNLIIEFGSQTTGVYFLCDITGKQVLSGTINSSQAMLNVASLPDGLYMLIVQTENGNTAHKLVIRR